jgi:site-specific recombinase XerD
MQHTPCRNGAKRSSTLSLAAILRITKQKRRTSFAALLCHQAGGELEQIQFLLGHVSVQTTEQYLGYSAFAMQ